MKKKKFLTGTVSLLLILVLVVSLFSSCVSSGVELNYEINEDGKTCTVLGIKKLKGDILDLPQVIDGYTVTVIGEGAFSDAGFKTVSVPSTVIEIKDEAFARCVQLEKIDFAENSELKVIGYHTFVGCDALTSIVFPDGVVEIGAFFWNFHS